MSSFFLLPGAERDLEAIYKYTVEEWSERQAVIYLDGLRIKLEQLAAFPRSGPRWRAEARVRVSIYGQHRILYREVPGGVEVGRIVHQARRFRQDLDVYERFAKGDMSALDR